MSASREAESPATRLRRRAMDYLARREHTHAELMQKLSRRFPDEEHELIRDVVDLLREENLQSDERFLESYLNARLRAGMGPLKVRLELQQKGIDAGDCEQAFGNFPEELWFEQAVEALTRRFPCTPPSMKERQKAWRFLQQRGFEAEMIRDVLKYSGDDLN